MKKKFLSILGGALIGAACMAPAAFADGFSAYPVNPDKVVIELDGTGAGTKIWVDGVLRSDIKNIQLFTDYYHSVGSDLVLTHFDTDGNPMNDDERIY